MTDEFKLARKILRLATRLVTFRSRDVEEVYITSEQAEALRFFANNPGASASELKDYLDVSHQAARSLVERMRKRDFVCLCASPTDARAKSVHLTDQGAEMFEHLNKLGSSAANLFFGNFTEDEMLSLSSLLDKIDENITARQL